MDRRLLAGLLTLALLAAGAALWLVRGGSGRGAAPERPAPPAALPPDEASTPAPEVPASASQEEAGRHAAPPRGTDELAGERVPLSGSVVVEDPDGELSGTESGTLSLELARGERTERLQVEVTHGAFRTEVPAGAELGVLSLVLGDRRAIPGAEDGSPLPARFPIPADGVLPLSARWPPPTLLHVRAAEDSSELTGVEVVAAASAELAPCAAPGRYDASQVMALDAASPVDLSGGPAPVQGVVWARAPGHAWARAQLDLERGGDGWVALERSGTLEVELVGRSPRGAVLRLYSDERYEPVVEVPADAEHIVLESLPPRDYRASVERGESWSDPTVLVEGDVLLPAGETRHLTLHLERTGDARAGPSDAGRLARGR